MARNEEKAQSMLYRFREAQAAELGISTKTDRRPRLASSCQDLRQCERWRGEILREISRKVSKIQDAGLTDYEVRDLNDEINKLLREKGHWETQIINLGGANYRRIGSSTFDGAGRSAPGQRGYKYFGRAKELPGVKELFEGVSKQQAEIEGLKKNEDPYSVFKNQGPSYFGDLDEYGAEGQQLLDYESTQQKEDWVDTFDSIAVLLGLPTDHSITPPFPIPHKNPPIPPPETPSHQSTSPSKRGRPKRKSAQTSAKSSLKNKKQATNEEPEHSAVHTSDQIPSDGLDPSNGAMKELTKAFLQASSVLEAEDIQPPPVPDSKQWEQLIMQLQKAALLKEYIG
ncbi:hypothetical protein O181_066342 [Austropuccinia psidii MF-1]|uniref:Pre-mRNA-splicing factor ISY1 n=1 Tax=Austropuccinia psidii MF-1 TaxID=1389203 RepID=A0A9Q3EVA3_9BASI|nr:hypothetical protein [Austropuccinia psidii MF-1]